MAELRAEHSQGANKLMTHDVRRYSGSSRSNSVSSHRQKAQPLRPTNPTLGWGHIAPRRDDSEHPTILAVHNGVLQPSSPLKRKRHPSIAAKEKSSELQPMDRTAPRINSPPKQKGKLGLNNGEQPSTPNTLSQAPTDLPDRTSTNTTSGVLSEQVSTGSKKSLDTVSCNSTTPQNIGSTRAPHKSFEKSPCILIAAGDDMISARSGRRAHLEEWLKGYHVLRVEADVLGFYATFSDNDQAQKCYNERNMSNLTFPSNGGDYPVEMTLFLENPGAILTQVEDHREVAVSSTDALENSKKLTSIHSPLKALGGAVAQQFVAAENPNHLVFHDASGSDGPTATAAVGPPPVVFSGPKATSTSSALTESNYLTLHALLSKTAEVARRLSEDTSSVITPSEDSSVASKAREFGCHDCKSSHTAAYNPLVHCSLCDRRFHKSCQKPSLDKDHAISSWRCYRCLKKGKMADKSTETPRTVSEQQDITQGVTLSSGASTEAVTPKSTLVPSKQSELRFQQATKAFGDVTSNGKIISRKQESHNTYISGENEVENELARIDARETSDADAPGFEDEKLAYVQRSKDRALGIEAAEIEKRKQRAPFLLLSESENHQALSPNGIPPNPEKTKLKASDPSSKHSDAEARRVTSHPEEELTDASVDLGFPSTEAGGDIVKGPSITGARTSNPCIRAERAVHEHSVDRHESGDVEKSQAPNIRRAKRSKQELRRCVVCRSKGSFGHYEGKPTCMKCRLDKERQRQENSALKSVPKVALHWSADFSTSLAESRIPTSPNRPLDPSVGEPLRLDLQDLGSGIVLSNKEVFQRELSEPKDSALRTGPSLSESTYPPKEPCLSDKAPLLDETSLSKGHSIRGIEPSRGRSSSSSLSSLSEVRSEVFATPAQASPTSYQHHTHAFKLREINGLALLSLDDNPTLKEMAEWFCNAFPSSPQANLKYLKHNLGPVLTQNKDFASSRTGNERLRWRFAHRKVKRTYEKELSAFLRAAQSTSSNNKSVNTEEEVPESESSKVQSIQASPAGGPKAGGYYWQQMSRGVFKLARGPAADNDCGKHSQVRKILLRGLAYSIHDEVKYPHPDGNGKEAVGKIDQIDLQDNGRCQFSTIRYIDKNEATIIGCSNLGEWPRQFRYMRGTQPVRDEVSGDEIKGSLSRQESNGISRSLHLSLEDGKYKIHVDPTEVDHQRMRRGVDWVDNNTDVEDLDNALPERSPRVSTSSNTASLPNQASKVTRSDAIISMEAVAQVGRASECIEKSTTWPVAALARSTQAAKTATKDIMLPSFLPRSSNQIEELDERETVRRSTTAQSPDQTHKILTTKLPSVGTHEDAKRNSRREELFVPSVIADPRRMLVYKDFDEAFPEYKPWSAEDREKKIKEIISRPSRKATFGKRLAFARTHRSNRHVEIIPRERLAADTSRSLDSEERLVRKHGRGVADGHGENGSCGDEKTIKPSNAGIRELLGLPENFIPAVYENQLAFRDGTLVNGRLPRTKVFYKVGRNVAGQLI